MDDGMTNGGIDRLDARRMDGRKVDRCKDKRMIDRWSMDERWIYESKDG